MSIPAKPAAVPAKTPLAIVAEYLKATSTTPPTLGELQAFFKATTHQERAEFARQIAAMQKAATPE